MRTQVFLLKNRPDLCNLLEPHHLSEGDTKDEPLISRVSQNRFLLNIQFIQ